MKGCPFCTLKKSEILKSNKHANLILAKSPYTKDHLLVIPKKHKMKLSSLTKYEKEDVEKLIYFGMKKLHKKYKNVSVLYKEGKRKEIGKSIDHLHYHLIPNLAIGACDINNRTRKIYSDEEYLKKINEVKKRLK